MSSSLEQVYEDSIQRYQAIVDSADAQYRAEPDPQLSHLYRVTAKRYRKKVLCTQNELAEWIQRYQAIVDSADAQYRVSQKRSLNKLLRSLSHSSSLEQVYEDSIQRYQAIVDSADAQYRAEPDPQLSHLYRVTAKRYRKKVLCTQKELSDWIQRYQAVVDSADAQYRVEPDPQLSHLYRVTAKRYRKKVLCTQNELSDCMDCMSPPSFTPLSARSQQQDLGQVAQPSGPAIPRVSILISFLIVVPLLLGLNFFDKDICPSLNPSNPVLKFCR